MLFAGCVGWTELASYFCFRAGIFICNFCSRPTIREDTVHWAGNLLFSPTREGGVKGPWFKSHGLLLNVMVGKGQPLLFIFSNSTSL